MIKLLFEFQAIFFKEACMGKKITAFTETEFWKTFSRKYTRNLVSYELDPLSTVKFVENTTWKVSILFVKNDTHSIIYF